MSEKRKTSDVSPRFLCCPAVFFARFCQLWVSFPLSQPRSHATFFLLKIVLRSELKRIFATSFRWVSRSKSATKVVLNCKSYLSLSHSRVCSKSLNLLFPTMYEISKSSLVGHWLLKIPKESLKKPPPELWRFHPHEKPLQWDGGNPVKYGGASSSKVQHCEHLTSWCPSYTMLRLEVYLWWGAGVQNVINMKIYPASGFIARFRIAVNQWSSCRALCFNAFTETEDWEEHLEMGSVKQSSLIVVHACSLSTLWFGCSCRMTMVEPSNFHSGRHGM